MGNKAVTFVGGKLKQAGDTDTVDLDGHVNLGNANTDDIVLGGEIKSNIIPDADATYDLGSSAKRWDGVYGSQSNMQGQVILKTRTITITDSPYSVASDDYLILVDSSTGEVYVDLPNANVAGRTIIIKDSGNKAGTADGKIRVYAVTGQAIDGQPNRASNGNKGFITLVSDGSATWYWTSRAGFSG